MTVSRPERRAALAAAVLAAAIAVLTVLVATHNGPLLSFDARVVRTWEGAVVETGWHPVFLVVAGVSQPVVVLVASALTAAFLAIRRRARAAVWVLVIAVAQRLAYGLMKELVHRERPDLPHQIAGYSFPSGHATAIAATMGMLIVTTSVHVRRSGLRRALTGLWLGIAVLVGVDRIFLGAHNPSDVVAGWLLGAFMVCASSGLLGVAGRTRRPVVAPAAATGPEHRRVLGIVLNPTKIGDSETFKAQVGVAARAAGWDEPLWFETTVDDAGGSMARAAVAAGADVVVVAGGDGTVRVVCSEMAGTGVPVGVIPAGTGNLLARNLNIPLLRDDAIATVLTGQNRAIDAVKVSGDSLEPTRFVVMAGIGLDAAIMDGAPDALKASIGWPAYVVAGARYLRYPAVRLDIRVDGGEPVRRRARTVLIGNVGFLQAGIPLLPDARIDDGVIDVVVVAPRQLFGWLSLALRVMARQRRTDERLDRFTGRSVVLSAAHATPRQLDGDTVGAGTELRAEVEPGILIVRVPR